MDSTSEYINLIIKRLNNEIVDNQNVQLEIWLKEKPENKKLFDDYKIIWELTQNSVEPEIAAINIEDELDLIRKKIGLKNTKVVDIKPIKKTNDFWKYSVAIAAAVVVFIGVFFLFGSKTEKVTSQNLVVETTLPDNSQIILNRNSTVKYPKKFKTNRKVDLSGEAYFIVEHDSENPFVVNASGYVVEVVGTEFFVSSKDNSFEVVVNKGIVKVYSENNPSDSTILTAGKHFNVDKQIVNVQNKNYLAWKTGKIEFENKTLAEICTVLERTYGVEIIISDKNIKDMRMTATFNNQTIEAVLSVVEATLNVKITTQGNKIIIYK
ncbi:MAG: DUF4974 domain-containing protein [Bacteroidales bacterium]|nr:DUF4974 domain-containing protein [Bacteroidales bacterium]